MSTNTLTASAGHASTPRIAAAILTAVQHAHREILMAFSSVSQGPGLVYRHLLEASGHLDRARRELAALHGAAVVDALLSAGPEAAGGSPSPDYDAAIEAHPLGGYTIRLFDGRGTLTGRFGTRAQARLRAEMNFLRLKPDDDDDDERSDTA